MCCYCQTDKGNKYVNKYSTHLNKNNLTPLLSLGKMEGLSQSVCDGTLRVISFLRRTTVWRTPQATVMSHIFKGLTNPCETMIIIMMIMGHCRPVVLPGGPYMTRQEEKTGRQVPCVPATQQRIHLSIQNLISTTSYIEWHSWHWHGVKNWLTEVVWLTL